MAQPAAILNILVRANTQTAQLGLAKVNAQARMTAGRFGEIDKAAGKSSQRLRHVGRAATLAAGGGLVLLGVAAKKAFGEFQESEKATRQTEAVLKSTGHAAKVTAGHIEELANQISLKSGIDDEAIQSGENLLLTFGKIRNETGKGNKIFDRATQTITDMSVALGQDLKSSAIQVGKALQDPEKGMTALRRVGVNFTQTQQDMVKGWIAHGDQLKAQKFILRELTREFGGSAAAQATGTDKLRTAVNNLFEVFGKTFGPALEQAATKAARFINQMQSGTGAGGRFRDKLEEIWMEVRPIVEWFGRAAGKVAQFADKHRDITKIVGAVALVVAAFNKFKIGTAIKAVAAFTKAAIATPGKVRQALAGVKNIFTRVFGAAGTAGGQTAAERAASGIMGSFPQKEGRMKTTTKNVMTRVGKAGGVAMAAGVIVGLAGLSASIGQVLHKAKTNVIDPWVHRHFGKAGDVYTAIRDFIGANLPSTLPGAPLLREIFGKGAGQPIVDFLGANFAPFSGHLGDAPGSLATVRKISLAMGLSGGLGPGQGYRPGDPGWHGAGRALDNSGPPAAMLKFAQLMAAKYGSNLLELIYTPLGFSIKNGKQVAPYAQADHFDHVHVAMAKGGTATRNVRALVGEEGPEIVDLPVGARVHSFSKSKRMVAAMGGTLPGFASGGLVARAAYRAGFRGSNLLRAVAEARGESGWNERAVGDGGWSKGLMQIYTLVHTWARKLNLFDPFVNMRAAMRIFRSQGWGAWHADHRPHIQAARAAVAAFMRSRHPHHPAHHPAPKGTAGHDGKTTPWSNWAGTNLDPFNKYLPRWLRRKLRHAARLKLRAWMDSSPFAMDRALAELTPTLADDTKVARGAVSMWAMALVNAQRLGMSPARITQAATELKSARDWLTELTGTATTTDTGEPSESATLLRQLLAEANQRTAVSQAQYGVLKNMPFGGSFADGGVIPGPLGAPRVIVGHGGEVVGQPGGVQVIVNGDIVNVPRGKKAVEVRDVRGGSRAALPGRGGGITRLG